MTPFEADVIDRLARIEEGLKNQTAVTADIYAKIQQNTDDIDDLKGLKFKALGVIGFIVFITGCFTGTHFF